MMFPSLIGLIAVVLVVPQLRNSLCLFFAGLCVNGLSFILLAYHEPTERILPLRASERALRCRCSAWWAVGGVVLAAILLLSGIVASFA